MLNLALCLKRLNIQVNCLTEIFIDKALERAALLDEQLKKTGKPVGPLHGLPVSLKDQIRLTGLETSMGKHRSHARNTIILSPVQVTSRGSASTKKRTR